MFWAKRRFYIEDVRDPESGAELGQGPIRLAGFQSRILRAALEREPSGRFRWSTIVWSAPKKSGKTRVAAAVAAWLADAAGAYAEIYCLANDGKQSADRVLAAIKKSMTLGDGMTGWTDVKTRIELPSGAFIEAIPVDPSGEAGSQPTGTFWSEMWGFKLSAKERLWTELTIPPTRYGRAIRWVESYAGYVGESPVLEQLYLQGVDREEHPDGEARRHPDFPDLPVYVNERARLFCYWDHVPRLPWQSPDYYAAESAVLSDAEFRRIHRNEWVSSETEAIPIALWDACRGPVPAGIHPSAPIVLGIDASVSNDCCALVAVSKDARRPRDRAVMIRGVQIWTPPAGGQIDLTATLEKAIRWWIKNYNVVCVAYDAYQLHKLATDLRREGLSWFYEFSQGKERAVADKQFVDLVLARAVTHDGDPELREHVRNAAGKTTGDEKTLRFVKKADRLKIDGLVAASMGSHRLLSLNL